MPPLFRLADVSIRAPAWGATKAARGKDGVTDVSIRAPAWGATIDREIRQRRNHVSIRAPAWGATAIMQWQVQPA